MYFITFPKRSGKIGNQLPSELAGLIMHPFLGVFPALWHLPTPNPSPYISKKKKKLHALKLCLSLCFGGGPN